MENGDYSPACACSPGAGQGRGDDVDAGDVEEAQAELAGLSLGLFEKEVSALFRRSGVPAITLKKIMSLHEQRFPEVHAKYAEFQQTRAEQGIHLEEPLQDQTVCHDVYSVCVNFDHIFDDENLETCPVCHAPRQRDIELQWRSFDLGKIIRAYFLNPCIARALKFAPSFYLNKLETGFGANHIENFTDGSKFREIVKVNPWLLEGDGMVRTNVY